MPERIGTLRGRACRKSPLSHRRNSLRIYLNCLAPARSRRFFREFSFFFFSRVPNVAPDQRWNGVVYDGLSAYVSVARVGLQLLLHQEVLQLHVAPHNDLLLQHNKAMCGKERSRGNTGFGEEATQSGGDRLLLDPVEECRSDALSLVLMMAVKAVDMTVPVQFSESGEDALVVRYEGRPRA
nr:hypothetical protein [Prosthecochloris aestuarii]